ncbi:MAG TPA: terminase small subunit [Gemmataceae bacterium]|nr:terminase small subunit [Gemmataceae bacterium]
MSAAATPARQPGALTPRQQRFVEEYLIDLNATAAYRRAGYAAKTDNAAAASASALLRNPKVAAVIQVAKSERSARCRLAADRVLDEVAAIAFSDIRDIGFDENGKLIETNPGATRTVAAYAYSRRTRRSGTSIQYSIRLWDKIRALELLMRHYGLLDRPLTLETVLALLPPEVSSLLRQLLVEAANAPALSATPVP